MTESFEEDAGAAAAAEAAQAPSHDLQAPRITIEAFCVTPEFATAVKAAAGDRRMSKARVTVGMGGADVAAKRYANVLSPDLILVETEQAGFGLFAELEPLASVCDENTRVLVVGPSNDVSLYRELIRQGVSEYLVAPCAPMQLIEAIANVYEEPGASPSGRVVAVYGVKGGVGSSVLAHNIGVLLAEQSDRDTVLVDLDGEFGTLSLDFNVEVKTSLADALSDLDGLDDVKLTRLLHAALPNVKLLTASASLAAPSAVTEEAMGLLIDALRRAGDFVVLDTPQRWTADTCAALRQADEVVLVATPDLASLRNVKSVFDWLKAERLHDSAPRVVLNQMGAPKRPEIAAKDFGDILEAEIDLSLPYEPAVFGAAINNGEMLSAVPGGAKIVEKLAPFAEKLSGRALRKGAERSGGVLGQLIGRLRRQA
ncbi:MAG: AAA family ATPase [Pseudomonadota bacterium]